MRMNREHAWAQVTVTEQSCDVWPWRRLPLSRLLPRWYRQSVLSHQDPWSRASAVCASPASAASWTSAGSRGSVCEHKIETGAKAAKWCSLRRDLAIGMCRRPRKTDCHRDPQIKYRCDPHPLLWKGPTPRLLQKLLIKNNISVYVCRPQVHRYSLELEFWGVVEEQRELLTAEPFHWSSVDFWVLTGTAYFSAGRYLFF